MEINFVESNPGPVKCALALMGLIEPVYRLPMVPVQPANRAKIEKVLESLGLLATVASEAAS
jgi:4-hydroxy-tetrahydrodipicolinate synthase